MKVITVWVVRHPKGTDGRESAELFAADRGVAVEIAKLPIGAYRSTGSVLTRAREITIHESVDEVGAMTPNEKARRLRIRELEAELSALRKENA